MIVEAAAIGRGRGRTRVPLRGRAVGSNGPHELRVGGRARGQVRVARLERPRERHRQRVVNDGDAVIAMTHTHNA